MAGPYKFRDKRTKEIIEFDWQGPGEPTKADIDMIVAERNKPKERPKPEPPLTQVPGIETPRFPTPTIPTRHSLNFSDYTGGGYQPPVSKDRPINLPPMEEPPPPLNEPVRQPKIPGTAEQAGGLMHWLTTSQLPKEEAEAIKLFGKVPVIGDFALEPMAEFEGAGLTSPLAGALTVATLGGGAIAAGPISRAVKRVLPKVGIGVAADITKALSPAKEAARILEEKAAKELAAKEAGKVKAAATRLAKKEAEAAKGPTDVVKPTTEGNAATPLVGATTAEEAVLARKPKPKYRLILDAEGKTIGRELVPDATNLAALGVKKEALPAFQQAAQQAGVPKITVTLPQDLAGAKPRFNIGTEYSYIPQFESDLDKALFTIAQKNPNKHDKRYLKFVMDNTGLDEVAARAEGVKVRQKIRETVQGQPTGPVKIPRIYKGADELPTAADFTGRNIEVVDPRVASTGQAQLPTKQPLPNLEPPKNATTVKINGKTYFMENGEFVGERPPQIKSTLPDVEPIEPPVVQPKGAPQLAYPGGPEASLENYVKARDLITQYYGSTEHLIGKNMNEIIEIGESIDPEAFLKKTVDDAVPPASVIDDALPPNAAAPPSAPPGAPPEPPSLPDLEAIQPPKEASINDFVPANAEEQAIMMKDAIRRERAKGTSIDKIDHMVSEFLNLPKAAWTAIDYSGALRQGKGLIHRKEYREAIPAMFKAGWSEEGFKEIQNAIENKEIWKSGVMQKYKYKLGLTELAGDLSKREENMMSTWANILPSFASVKKAVTSKDFGYLNSLQKTGKGEPLVRASNRAYTGFLNKLRADTFENMIMNFEKAGLNPYQNPELLEATAEFIGSATGRGNLGRLEAATEVLNKYAFSPKFLKSKLDQSVLFPTRLAKAHPAIRAEMLKSQAGIAGYWATLAGLGAMAGAEVGLDPTSSDFTKIKIGNTRLDVLGGLQQPLVAAAKIGSGLSTSPTTGQTTEIGEKGFFLNRKSGFRGETPIDVGVDFLRTKASPWAGAAYDYYKGRTIPGKLTVDEMQRMDPQNYFLRMITPNLGATSWDLYSEDPKNLELDIPFTDKKIPGQLTKAGLAGAALFGEGVQVFEPPTPRSSGQINYKRNFNKKY